MPVRLKETTQVQQSFGDATSVVFAVVIPRKLQHGLDGMSPARAYVPHVSHDCQRGFGTFVQCEITTGVRDFAAEDA